MVSGRYENLQVLDEDGFVPVLTTLLCDRDRAWIFVDEALKWVLTVELTTFPATGLLFRDYTLFSLDFHEVVSLLLRAEA